MLFFFGIDMPIEVAAPLVCRILKAENLISAVYFFTCDRPGLYLWDWLHSSSIFACRKRFPKAPDFGCKFNPVRQWLSARVRSCEGEVFPARKSLLRLANPVNGGRSKPDWFTDSDVHRARKRKNLVITPKGKCFICLQYKCNVLIILIFL